MVFLLIFKYRFEKKTRRESWYGRWFALFGPHSVEHCIPNAPLWIRLTKKEERRKITLFLIGRSLGLPNWIEYSTISYISLLQTILISLYCFSTWYKSEYFSCEACTDCRVKLGLEFDCRMGQVVKVKGSNYKPTCHIKNVIAFITISQK